MDGTGDILIAVMDGLKGFPEAIETIFPNTVDQFCIVHQICYSMQFASWKERKVVAATHKPIYRANNADSAQHELEAFDAGEWSLKYPASAKSWHRNWEQVIPFFGFSSNGHLKIRPCRPIRDESTMTVEVRDYVKQY